MDSNIYKYFSRKECLKDRDKEYPLTPELEANLKKLLTAINLFRQLYGKPMIITSLYRPGHYNTGAGGAKASNHMVCLAVDFADPNKELAKYCMDNLYILEQCGLYLEDTNYTKNWLHLQVVPPKSGKRVFIP